ncbi:proline--tRNA ligase [candidate division WOR-3 bacterium]|nr:proline--tRNA ligase [candidate division WOR-3 bacterium]MCK4527065.1 proline--tRNA ligase [candidate division WOR-3 bacterium]
MKWSNAFIPTRKEVPREAQSPSHRFLLRAGMIKPLSSGIYTYLPLGWKVLMKIQNIIRREMDRIGAQELLMPALTPASIWEETGRWEEYGDEMFRLTDRRNSDMALAPTHEEVITAILRDEIKSYRDLPQVWYQIQVKYRDEKRPRGAVLRARTFIMKDSYSFDRDREGLEISFLKHAEAYTRIFSSCGLKTTVVEALSGLMGGSKSKEFMVASDSGEDRIVECLHCGYASNIEVADPLPSKVAFKGGDLKKVHTPVSGSVKEIAKFFNVKPSQLMKSILYIREKEPIWIVIRGDYDIDEEKLQGIFTDIRIASEEEVCELVGAQAGYVSPMGSKYLVYSDFSIRGIVGLISGANEDYYHFMGIAPERDIKIKDYLDIREYREGDLCPQCSTPLEWKNVIELGHIYKLGTKYSKAMGAFYLDEDGKEKPIVMGSYGIGVERIMASAIEQFHDEKGIIWPLQIAPYHIIIINLNPTNPEGVALSEDLYKLLNREYEILYDDRDLRSGYKFNDADLIGIPLQIIIGNRGLKRGIIEIKIRGTEERMEVPPEKIKEEIDRLWKSMQKIRLEKY